MEHNSGNLVTRQSLTTRLWTIVYVLSIPLAAIGLAIMVVGAAVLSGPFDRAGAISVGLGFVAIALALQGSFRTESLLHEMRRGEIYEKIAMVYGYCGTICAANWPYSEDATDFQKYILKRILSDVKAIRSIVTSIDKEERASLNAAREELDKQLREKHYEDSANGIKKEFDEMMGKLPKRGRPGRMKLGGIVFTEVCAGIALIFAVVGIRYLTLGVPAAAQAFWGLAIATLSFAFFEVDVIRHPRRFAVFQLLFIIGIALVTPFIQTGDPFSTMTSFEVGSFSLLVTGFFITRNDGDYSNILLLSATATMALFIAGMLSAFKDVPGAALPAVGIGSVTVYLITALFLVGSVDLTFLSVLLFGLVVKAARTDPRLRLPAP